MHRVRPGDMGLPKSDNSSAFKPLANAERIAFRQKTGGFISTPIHAESTAIVAGAKVRVAAATAPLRLPDNIGAVVFLTHF